MTTINNPIKTAKEKSAKKKIIFIIKTLAGGGPQRALLNLFNNLDQEKINPVFVFYTDCCSYSYPKGVKCRFLSDARKEEETHLKKIVRGIKNRFLPLSYAKKKEEVAYLEKIIKEEKPEVILSFLFIVNIDIIPLMKKLPFKTKLIISERNMPSFKIIPPNWKIHSKKIKNLYPKADKIIAVSNGVKKDLVENFGVPQEKIQVIYNGVDINKVKKLATEEITECSWFNDNVPIITNIGRLVPQKGQEYLIKAFEIIRKNFNCRLAILGVGPKENELKKLTLDLGVGNDVAFLGFQKNPFKFMARSSVFVLSSIYEGFPNSMLEAMACGIPVISTDCPSGPNEIIKNGVNGLLVPTKDDFHLAESIITLLQNRPLAEKIATQASRDIIKFSVKKMAEEYSAVLEI